MDGMHGHNSTESEYMMIPENPMMMISPDYDRFPVYGSDELMSAASAISEAAASATAELRRTTTCSRRDHVNNYHNNNNNNNNNNNTYNNPCQPPSLVKAKIASHPYYPRLLQAYIDCQKVGAPPEIASLLDEIQRENDVYDKIESVSTCVGADPELDEFMETYCNILMKYKSDLSRPFDEATSFLSKIEAQLGDLCKDEGVVSSDDEFSGGEIEVQDAQTKTEDRELKDRLLHKFGSHISKLKMEFSKKKQKGKLPKEARDTLLDWWKVHNKWPYPTEADKIFLAESTGLDQKQINNWFINQRKRHWKPSEDMQLAVMDSISGQFYATDD